MSNQLVAATEESLINRISRVMSEHIREHGPGFLPHFPFSASQAPKPTDQQPTLTPVNALPADLSVDGQGTKDSEQMTIFHGGQVVVLNLPTKKAEAIIQLATIASSFAPVTANSIDAAAVVNPSTHASGNGARALTPYFKDLPIQRKASLSLFFEKRRNRINARAPYNVKGEESADEKPWLALAGSSGNSLDT